MSTPLPGQIRCPTCHRSTPPAAFCTQCGTSIPASARARPRGLDREELQDRIRTHRPGEAAFRRGSPVGDEYGHGQSPYQAFRPEPEDELILHGADAGEAGAAPVDNTADGFDDQSPALPSEDAGVAAPLAAAVTPPPTAAAVTGAPSSANPSPPREPQPVPWKRAPASHTAPAPASRVEQVEAPAPQWTAPDEPYEAAEPYDYRYRPGDYRDGQRGSGISPLAIGGFVLLGVLAIGVGVLVSGVFSGGVAVASPTPTPTATAVPTGTLAPTGEPTPSSSGSASAHPGNGSPLPFPDGFSARTEPCANEPASQDGCSSSGASVSGGSVWVWVGFRNATDPDLLGVTIVDASGASVGNGSLALASIGCGNSCSGWARFRFGGLSPGTYKIRVDRNGLPASEAPFTVT